MNVVRMNITLPAELVRQLEELIHRGNKSRFIAEALKQRIEEIRNEELQYLLEEGYKATKQEEAALIKEFEPIDLDGWDEY